jgi:hypothetical protein
MYTEMKEEKYRILCIPNTFCVIILVEIRGSVVLHDNLVMMQFD